MLRPPCLQEIQDLTRGGVFMALAAITVSAFAAPSLERWLPERPRQVLGAAFFMHGRKGAAIRWGFELGTGLATYIVTPGMYGLLALAFLQREVMMSLTIGFAYGITRGATIAWFALRRTKMESADPGCPVPKGRFKRTLRVPMAVATLAGLVAIIPLRP